MTDPHLPIPPKSPDQAEERTLVEPSTGPTSAPTGPGELDSNQLTSALRDRYRLIKVLGRGGFGVVYLAHDRVLDQPVAIKVLKLGLTSPSDRDRFLFEARTAAKLRHEAIVNVFDIIQTEDGLQMVMEFYPGGTLAQLIHRQGALPPRRALLILRRVALGLAHAHAKQIIHRDIKPANIFLTDGDAAKLGDFGIAAHYETHEHTATGDVIGTPLYMAPEQTRNAKDVDPRSDVYALGMTLYHMVSGKTPRVVDLDLVPRELRGLIKRATAEDRHERPVSCQQLVVMIDQALDALKPPRSGAAPPPSPAHAPAKAAPSPSAEVAPSPSPTAALEEPTVTHRRQAEPAPDTPAPPRAARSHSPALAAISAVAVLALGGGLLTWRLMVNRQGTPAPAAETSVAGTEVASAPTTAPPTDIPAAEAATGPTDSEASAAEGNAPDAPALEPLPLEGSASPAPIPSTIVVEPMPELPRVTLEELKARLHELLPSPPEDPAERAFLFARRWVELRDRDQSASTVFLVAAIWSFELAAGTGPEEPTYPFFLARLLEALGRPKAAEEWKGRLQALDPAFETEAAARLPEAARRLKVPDLLQLATQVAARPLEASRP